MEREKVENILLNTAKKCVEEDFAEVILLACGGFEWIALDLGKKLGVPIVPPNLAGLKIAELLVDLNKKAGLGLSKIGAFYIPPERLEGIEAELITSNKTAVDVCVFSKARQDISGNISHVVALLDNRKNKEIELELEKSFFELAETISRALGCRDPYTEDHGRKVAKLCKLTGQKLGLGHKQLQGLYVGGLLHDVGKIAIPEIILSKPGRLTEEEMNLIRSHTKHGYSILKNTTMPWPVAEIAFSHHERLDGSGYPLGIKANKLGIEIRIVCVCDVVEAMSSHRPYRPRKTEKQVIKEICSGSRTKYDEDVVDAVLDVIRSGDFRLS